MRLIDADKLKEIVKDEFDGVCVYDVSSSEVINDFHEIIDKTPTAEGEPIRHGHWIYSGNAKASIYKKCSVCGTSFANFGGIKYCSECGAKMDEVNDGQIN